MQQVEGNDLSSVFDMLNFICLLVLQVEKTKVLDEGESLEVMALVLKANIQLNIIHP